MIQLDDITLARGGKHLVEQLSLRISTGERIGVVGRNGCGKSTLFAFILRQIDAEAGEFSLPGDWRIAHIAQETPAGDESALAFVLAADTQYQELTKRLEDAEAHGGDVSALHDALDRIDGYTAEPRAARILAGLGFPQEQHAWPVRQFSGGWRGRLNLARTLFQPSELLLLDEPTNHLDIETVLWLQRWLTRYTGAALIISHDREFLDATTTGTLWYQNGRAVVYRGGLSEAEQQRAMAEAQRAAEFARQQKKAQHLQSFVDRFRAKASKAKQAQSRLKMLERLTAAAPAHSETDFDFAFSCADRLPVQLVRSDHMALGYTPDKPVLNDVSLTLSPGDRLGVLGLNGAGKSTLIKGLCGKLEPLSGELAIGRKVTIGHFAQHQLEQLREDQSPLQHLRDRCGPEPAEMILRKFLGRFGFHGEMATEAIGPRSGGERARLALALLAYAEPAVLMLDEPTNHLDLSMRQSLTLALQDFPGALLVVSHDRSLLEASCDEWLVVAEGQVRRFTGSFSDYADSLLAATPAQDSGGSSGGNNRRSQRQAAARKRETIRPIRNQLTKIERQISTVQEKLKAADQRMADPSFYSGDDQDAVADTLRQRADLAAQLDDLESKWLTLSEEIEAVECA